MSRYGVGDSRFGRQTFDIGRGLLERTRGLTGKVAMFVTGRYWRFLYATGSDDNGGISPQQMSLDLAPRRVCDFSFARKMLEK